jgi:uncharacterized protein with von Willebrand factor type A (vWA) domain
MDKLSKEELLALLEKKPRKQRKPADLDEEKKTAMLERLAAMRETVKKNREAKKTVLEGPVREKEIDAVFEKKYGSKFDKMAELLTDLNENTREVVKMKKEKATKRELKEKEVEVKEAPPLANEGKPLAHPVNKLGSGGLPPPIRAAFPVPNTPIFRKGNTRF